MFGKRINNFDGAKEYDDFKSEFCGDVSELLVLIRKTVNSAFIKGDFYTPSACFIASIDVKTGEFSESYGTLLWMIKCRKQGSGWGFNLKKFKVYRVKVRKSIKDENRYMLFRASKVRKYDKRFDEMIKYRNKPIEMNDEKFGKLVLNRDCSEFSGSADWLGEEISLSLGTDEYDGETAKKSLEFMREIFSDVEAWDKKFRDYAAEELTENANDWASETDEPSITEEDFKKRMSICCLDMNPDGNFSVFYDDDNMFLGHWIEVRGNINGEFDMAGIAG